MYLEHDAASMWETVMQKIKKISPTAYSDYLNKITPLRVTEDNVWELGVSDIFFGKIISDSFGGILSEAFRECGFPEQFRCVDGYEVPKVKKNKKSKQSAIEQLTFDFVDVVSAEETPEVEEEKAVAKTPELAPVPLTESEEIIEKNRRLSQQPIQSNHNFANFVVSEDNRAAFEAAKIVASNPGMYYNPLYIYGSTGTGKTHLLQAVANEAIAKNIRVRYASCEELLNDFISILQQKKDMYAFRRSVRDVDILLIDDVHLLSNKKGMQEEFFNMFNTLQANGRQIILTSDKQPVEIEGLEARLISRFESGLMVEVLPPGYEARLAILMQMRDHQKSPYRISNTILEFIAQNISANVRRLKGAFLRVVAYCTLKKSDNISVQDVEKLLQQTLNKEASSKSVSIDEIQRTVAQTFGLKLNDILGNKRPKNIAEARLIAMYLSRKHTTLSLAEIGSAFGKTHATILNAMQKVPEMCESSENTRRVIMQIESTLTHK